MSCINHWGLIPTSKLKMKGSTFVNIHEPTRIEPYTRVKINTDYHWGTIPTTKLKKLRQAKIGWYIRVKN